MRAHLAWALAGMVSGPLAAGGVQAQAEAQPGEAAAAEAPSFPPRTAIAGIPGLYTRSRVVFFEAPDLPHELQVVMLFAGRARIQLSAQGADWHARQLEYRAGDSFWFVESGSSTSVALAAERRAELHLRVELRRALLMWPEGNTWSAEGPTRTSAVADRGVLEVTLDEGGRPLSMRALSAAGQELEAYSAIEWFEQYDRSWPRHMDFSYRGTRVWREELLELLVRPNFLDWFFVPADRRPQQPLAFDAAGHVRNIDLPPVIVHRVEVDGALGWEDLLAWAAERVSNEQASLLRAGLPHRIEEPVNFLLAADGRPTHCELRLTPAPGELPPGWERLDERPALTVFGEGPPARLERTLADLRALAPAEADPGRPYLRMKPADGPGGKTQIVLPLVP